jgi:hypothetical protein
MLDHVGDGGWCVDDHQFEAKVACMVEVMGEGGDGGAEKGRGGRLTLVPPIGQAALRIGIDDRDRPGAADFGGDGKMSCQRGFAGPALLRCQRENVHGVSRSDQVKRYWSEQG